MLKVGLTGGIGSGKSLISMIFAELNVPVYHADIEARRLMETNQELINRIIDEFGSSIYRGNKLQRQLLGEIVFADEKRLQKLNSIVHPLVHKDFIAWTKRQAEVSYVIEEAAILFESGGAKNLDFVIFVKADIETRIRRVMMRDKVEMETVLKRVNNQMDDSIKEKLSDFIIYNENDSMILPQIVDLHKKLNKLNG